MSSRSASTPSRTLGGALVPTESQSFSTSKIVDVDRLSKLQDAQEDNHTLTK
ncbi:hypothetical protein GYH30_009934 [Glycine max]|nr:hypothetical protein GYH30_009934 [Glycine max]